VSSLLSHRLSELGVVLGEELEEDPVVEMLVLLMAFVPKLK
jgi:hypothetical protein